MRSNCLLYTVLPPVFLSLEKTGGFAFYKFIIPHCFTENKM